MIAVTVIAGTKNDRANDFTALEPGGDGERQDESRRRGWTGRTETEVRFL